MPSARKPPPLAVQVLTEAGGAPMGWYSKGHHRPAEFLAAIDELEGAPQRLDVENVTHAHWRCVPGLDEDGDPAVLFRPAKPGPGAFPVTVLEGERTEAGAIVCAWCSREQPAGLTTCSGCGHNPGVPRVSCGCARCLAPMNNPAQLELAAQEGGDHG
jgi:hypothetical protein